MLGGNELATHGSPPPIYMRQAFMTAARAFQSIDANTQGVIVPYGPAGKYVIAELCATGEPEKQYALLRRAQRYTIDLLPWVLEPLRGARALHEVKAGTGILYLEDRYYSNEVGLNVEGTEKMEFLDA
jgi:CRISPR-associated endonuclease/helicase Cas3